MRVLLLHNRYRIEGGEERSVDLQLRALERAGVAHRLLEVRSDEVGRGTAATTLLRGGTSDLDVDADIVHVHNMQPLLGPRALEAAQAAGARVVMHLHNARLFCAIGVASRDGGPCFRCRGRLTLPGLVLNCRGSLPEAAAYAAALSLQQPRVWQAVDRFVAPSAWAAGQLALLGVPSDRLEVLPHYVPEPATESRADEGEYALVAARLSEEKGIDVAIEASAATGVPLRVAGEGPAAESLIDLARRLDAPVEFLGKVGRPGVAELLARAAMVVMPSRYHEFSPYSALEAMAAGVPVVATRMGGLPELVGDGVAPGDVGLRMRALWSEPEARRNEGESLLARVRAGHSEERYIASLLALYERLL